MSTLNNSAQQSVVAKIEGRVEQLIEDHKRLLQQNRQLIEQCNDLKRTKQSLQEKIATLEHEVTLSSLTAELGKVTKSNKRAKAYINQLMREVDKCITLLQGPVKGGEAE